MADSAVAALGGRGGRPSVERGEGDAAAGGIAGRGTSSSSEPVAEGKFNMRLVCISLLLLLSCDLNTTCRTMITKDCKDNSVEVGRL